MQYERFAELAEAEQLLRSGRRGAAVRRARSPTCSSGYDGKYYLCCSDWEKQAPMGTVFDGSFLDVTAAKLRHMIDRQAVCKTCNLDPINKLTEALQEHTAGSMDRAAVDQLRRVVALGEPRPSRRRSRS